MFVLLLGNDDGATAPQVTMIRRYLMITGIAIYLNAIGAFDCARTDQCIFNPTWQAQFNAGCT